MTATAVQCIVKLPPTASTAAPRPVSSCSRTAGYLAAERDLGRIAADADVGILALTLIGSAHMLFAGGDAPPAEVEVRKIVAAVVSTAG